MSHINFLLLILVILGLCQGEYESLTPPPADFKAAILGQHNKYRAQLAAGNVPGQPKPAYLGPLLWDGNLAESAKKYADKCIPRHDTYANRATAPYDYVGQNLYAGPTVQDAVDLWFIEYKDYNYSTISCAPGKKCGHYTQLVWSASTHVGCAYKDCTSPTYPYGYIVICNYGPAGNYEGENPY